MATLEKIRSKSALLLVIIGVALLAFILGDFFNSGRTLFGPGTTVAKIDGKSIDVQEFQRRVEQANQQMQNSGRKIDQAALQQQVLNEMVFETIYKDELSKLGLVVTDQELTDAMTGSGAEMLNRMIQQQYGVESAAQLHDMAYNPGNYNIPEETAQQLRTIWVNLEKQTEESLLQQKFNNLFTGAFVANELDARAIFEENGTTAHIAYVTKPYSTLADDQYQVSDAEIEKEWQAHKQKYAIPEENRTISYISVDIVPSPEDIAAGERAVNQVLNGLNATEGLEALDGKNDFVADRQRVATSKLRDARLKSFADSSAVGRASLISRMGNDITLAKLFGRNLEVDSINIDLVAVQGSKAVIDSVVTALNNGVSISEIGNRFNGVQGAQDSIWMSLLDPQIGQFKDALLTHATGTYFNPDTTANTNGGYAIRIKNRRSAVPVVDLALITYAIEPSNATVNTLESKLNKYLADNTTAESFANNAAAAGYQVFPATISASTPMLTGMEDTRSVIAWALDSKKGKVSPIFGDEQSGRFIAAALNDIYNDYTPARDPQVKSMLTNKVRTDKKAAAMIEQYKGKAKDLAGYALVMAAPVDSANVTFGQINPFNTGFAGSEAAALASVTEKGQLAGPLQGNNGVVVLQVVDVDKQGRPFNFDESAALYNRSRGAYALGRNIQMVLQGNKKVKNNILTFFK